MAAENATVEEVRNCTDCNKSLNKAKRYYRNGKYYCNKRCWKVAVQKAQKEKEKE